MRKRTLIIFTSLIFALSALSGCGIKGPLTMPDDEQKQQQTPQQPPPSEQKEGN